MCPSDVQVTPGNGDQEQPEQSEKEYADLGLETMNGGTDSQLCATFLDLGVSAGASTAPSGGEHDEILSEMRDACERQDCSTKVGSSLPRTISHSFCGVGAHEQLVGWRFAENALNSEKLATFH